MRTKNAPLIQLESQVKAVAERLGITRRELVRETRRAMIRLLAEKIANAEIQRREREESLAAEPARGERQESDYERHVRERGSDFPKDRR